MAFKKPLQDRFAGLWFFEPNSGCWLWSGRLAKGYGILPIEHPATSDKRVRKNKYAHRLSWELHFGPIPPKMEICHRCDTPACVRPDHLFLGTHRKNIDDMLRKGRGEKGEDRWNSALTESAVIAIRQSEEPYPVLAKRFGVTVSAIEAARNGATWAHVKTVAIGNPKDRLSHKGEAHKLSKLKEPDILAIRVRGENGERHKDIAADYNVTRSLVSMIVRRDAWGYV